MSGYISLIRHLGNAGSAQAYFGEVRPSGSHLESMRRVAAGEADAAAIDSNVLALWRRRDPPLVAGLRILESWGPFPIQPAVPRATLDPDRRDAVAATLRSLPNEPDTARALAEFGLIGFTGFPASLYEEEREALTACLGTP